MRLSTVIGESPVYYGQFYTCTRTALTSTTICETTLELNANIYPQYYHCLLRRNPPGNRVILLEVGQKSSTIII